MLRARYEYDYTVPLEESRKERKRQEYYRKQARLIAYFGLFWLAGLIVATVICFS